MMNVHLTANQGLLTATPVPTVAENSTVECIFECSTEWNDLVCCATFEDEHEFEGVDVPVEGGRAIVPNMFVVSPRFFVTLSGGDKMTTNKLEIKVQPTLKGVQ